MVKCDRMDLSRHFDEQTDHFSGRCSFLSRDTLRLFVLFLSCSFSVFAFLLLFALMLVLFAAFVSHSVIPFSWALNVSLAQPRIRTGNLRPRGARRIGPDHYALDQTVPGTSIE